MPLLFDFHPGTGATMLAPLLSTDTVRYALAGPDRVRQAAVPA